LLGFEDYDDEMDFEAEAFGTDNLIDNWVDSLIGM
jgi:hypothetical protein